MEDELQSAASSATQSSQRKRPTYKPLASGFSGEFVRIDPNAKFYDDEQVEGIHLLTDFDITREIQIRLGGFAQGPTDFFPAMWPVEMNATSVKMIPQEPYVVAPKPTGTSYIFYIDSNGDVFLENMTQHIFSVDKGHNFNLCNALEQPIFDTVLHGVMTREKPVGPSGRRDVDTEKAGRLTFVIHDAIRCNAQNLIDLPVLDRINFITEEIMKPRVNAVEEKSSTCTNEVFNLDIIEYKFASTADDYLSEGFEDHFKYPLHCLVFVPLRQIYLCGSRHNNLRWKENYTEVFVYRLKIPTGVELSKEAQLFVVGPKAVEIPFASITLTEELRKLDGRIIDCHYDNQQWGFLRVRHDREHPNSLKVIKRKFITVENPVSRELLCRMVLEKFKIPEV